MGYYSQLSMDLKFKSKEAMKEFLKEQSNIDGPFGDAFIERFTEPISKESYYFLELPDYLVKMGEFKTWIPELAKFGITGCLTVQGEEDGDLWGIRFYGEGRFRCYLGKIEYTEIELADL